MSSKRQDGEPHRRPAELPITVGAVVHLLLEHDMGAPIHLITRGHAGRYYVVGTKTDGSGEVTVVLERFGL